VCVLKAMTLIQWQADPALSTINKKLKK